MGTTAVAQFCSICKISILRPTSCNICKAKICKGCYGFAAFDEIEKKHKTGCKQCFKKAIQLDLTKNYGIFGQNHEKEIIFLHGATFSRLMFQSHANDLSKRGFRCILIDLPGHGSRMDQALTLQNCQMVIKQGIQLCKTKQITLIGGSLGGYILMNMLGKNPNLCKKAVVMMCGQDVGRNRGLKASLGLWAMNKSFNLLPQYVIANNFLSLIQNNSNLQAEKVLKSVRGGCYLRHGNENFELLKNCDYRQSLRRIEGKIPILFINGSEDYRDSEHIWLQAAGEDSKLLTYQKGDHFFSHDKRFYERLIQDLVNFIDK